MIVRASHGQIPESGITGLRQFQTTVSPRLPAQTTGSVLLRAWPSFALRRSMFDKFLKNVSANVSRHRAGSDDVPFAKHHKSGFGARHGSLVSYGSVPFELSNRTGPFSHRVANRSRSQKSIFRSESSGIGHKPRSDLQMKSCKK